MQVAPATVLSPGVAVPQTSIARAATRAMLVCGIVGGVVLALVLLGLKLAGWQALTVLTGSMRPTIDPGQVVLVSPERASAIRPGQIVTFRRPRGPGTLTHRVRSVRPRPGGELQVTTRGDANVGTETWRIPTSGTVGLHRATVPLLGGAIGYLVTGRGRPFFVGGGAVIATLLILAWIWLPEPDRWGRDPDEIAAAEPE